MNDCSIHEFWKLKEEISISYRSTVIRDWVSGIGKCFELSYFCIDQQVEELLMEGYVTSAFMAEKHAFLCHRCKTSSFTSRLLYVCGCVHVCVTTTRYHLASSLA